MCQCKVIFSSGVIDLNIFTKKKWSSKATAFATALGLSMVMACASVAAEYNEIEVFPKDVGMFTTVGKQQFLAFGYVNNGNTISMTNITRNVNWESSNEAIVSIDDNGVATLVSGKTYGQVKISCSYPKVGNASAAVNQLLLKATDFKK